MTPETRYRLEQTKDRAPSTHTFLWWPVLFIAIACLTRTEPGKGIVQEISQYHIMEAVAYQPERGQFDRYPNHNPVCGDEFWCVLGWKL